MKACHVNEENGAHRFSIVTAGRTLVGKEFDQIVSDAHKKAGQIIDTSKKEAALQKEKVMNKAEQEHAAMRILRRRADIFQVSAPRIRLRISLRVSGLPKRPD